MTKRQSCALCDQPVSPAHKPFCGSGCRDRDLLNWLGEGYRVAGAPADPNVQTGLDSTRDPD